MGPPFGVFCHEHAGKRQRRTRRAKPPSLAQHSSCRRPSTSPHSPFRTNRRTADIASRAAA
jgi:hypothetical protein